MGLNRKKGRVSKVKKFMAVVMTAVLTTTTIIYSDFGMGKLKVEAATQITTAEEFVQALQSTDETVEIVLNTYIDVEYDIVSPTAVEIRNNLTIDLNGMSLMNLPEGFFKVVDGGSLSFVNNALTAETVSQLSSGYTEGAVITVEGSGKVSVGDNIDVMSQDEMRSFGILAEAGGMLELGDKNFVSTADTSVMGMFTAYSTSAVVEISTVNGKTNVEVCYLSEAESQDYGMNYYVDSIFYQTFIQSLNPNYLGFRQSVFGDVITSIYIEEDFYTDADGTMEYALEEIHYTEDVDKEITLFNNSSMPVLKADGTIPDNLYVKWEETVSDTISYDYEDGGYYNDMFYVKAGSKVMVSSLDGMQVYALVCGNSDHEDSLAVTNVFPRPDGIHVVTAPAFYVNDITWNIGAVEEAEVATDYTVAYKNIEAEWSVDTLCHQDYMVITPTESGNKIAAPGANRWDDSLIVTGEGLDMTVEFVVGDLTPMDEAGEDATETYGLMKNGTFSYNLNCPPVIESVTDSAKGKPVQGTVTVTVQAVDTFTPEVLEYSFDGGQTWRTDSYKTFTETTVIEAGDIQVRDGTADAYGVTAVYEEAVDVVIDVISPTVQIDGESETDETGMKVYNGVIKIVAMDNVSSDLIINVYEGDVTDYANLTPIEAATGVSLYPQEVETIYTVIIEDEAGNTTREVIRLKAYSHELTVSYEQDMEYEYNSNMEVPLTLQNNGSGDIVIESVTLSDERFVVTEQSWGALAAGATLTATVQEVQSLLPGTYEVEMVIAYIGADTVSKVLSTMVTITVVEAEGTATLEVSQCYLGLDIDSLIRGGIVAENYNVADAVISYKKSTENDSAYTQVIPTETGTYTVRIALTGNEGYKDIEYIGEVTISTRAISTDMYIISGTQGSNGWYTSDVSIIPAEGYTFYLGDDVEAPASQIINESGEVTFAMRLDDGSITSTITVEVQIDTTAPVIGETEGIAMKTSLWQTFLEIITFGIYESEYSEVTVSCHDDESNVTISYYISDKALSMDEAIGCAYTEGSSFSINKEGNCVIYAKLENEAGLITYLSSEGMVFDVNGPVIAGATEGSSYSEAVTITITDDNLKAVTLNDIEQTVEDNRCTIVIEPTTAAVSYVVKASDMGGLENFCQFNMEAVPVESEEPTTSEEPVISEEPTISENPAVSEEPTVSENPVASEEPTVSEKPVESEKPVVSENPTISKEPATSENSVTSQNPANPVVTTDTTGNPLTGRPGSTSQNTTSAPRPQASEEPQIMSIRPGEKMYLEAGVPYWLDEGLWRVKGDNTLYRGGQKIRVVVSGEYEFVKE